MTSLYFVICVITVSFLLSILIQYWFKIGIFRDPPETLSPEDMIKLSKNKKLTWKERSIIFNTVKVVNNLLEKEIDENTKNFVFNFKVNLPFEPSKRALDEIKKHFVEYGWDTSVLYDWFYKEIRLILRASKQNVRAEVEIKEQEEINKEIEEALDNNKEFNNKLKRTK